MDERKTTVLAIAGSPRRGGNSETLLDEFIRGAESAGARVEKIRVCDMDIAPCTGCAGCTKTGGCVIRDDMQQIYPKLLDADWVVCATPMFFMNMPARMKAFVDRCQCLWSKRFLLEQPLRPGDDRIHHGGVIAVGGTKGPSLFNGLDQLLKCWFSIIDIEFDQEHSIYYRSVDHPGDAAAHPTAMADAYGFGLTTAAPSGVTS